MTYLVLDAVFLAIVLAVAVVAVVTRRAPRWGAVGIAVVVLLVTSIVFDNVMIGVGLVAYDPARISGLKLGIAPIEDFAYAIASAVLLPCLWALLPARRERSERGER